MLNWLLYCRTSQSLNTRRCLTNVSAAFIKHFPPYSLFANGSIPQNPLWQTLKLHQCGGHGAPSIFVISPNRWECSFLFHVPAKWCLLSPTLLLSPWSMGFGGSPLLIYYPLVDRPGSIQILWHDWWSCTINSPASQPSVPLYALSELSNFKSWKCPVHSAWNSLQSHLPPHPFNLTPDLQDSAQESSTPRASLTLPHLLGQKTPFLGVTSLGQPHVLPSKITATTVRKQRFAYLSFS